MPSMKRRILNSIKNGKNMFDKAFIFPTLVGESITAVNKRVKYYDVKLGSTKSNLYQIELTSDTPAK